MNRSPEVIEAVIHALKASEETLTWCRIIDSSTKTFPDCQFKTDQLEEMQEAAQETAHDCNAVIRAIGGIPIRFDLEEGQPKDALLRGISHFTNEGNWAFRYSMQGTEIEPQFLEGNSKRLHDVYRAALSD